MPVGRTLRRLRLAMVRNIPVAIFESLVSLTLPPLQPIHIQRGSSCLVFGNRVSYNPGWPQTSRPMMALNSHPSPFGSWCGMAGVHHPTHTIWFLTSYSLLITCVCHGAWPWLLPIFIEQIKNYIFSNQLSMCNLHFLRHYRFSGNCTGWILEFTLMTMLSV